MSNQITLKNFKLDISIITSGRIIELASEYPAAIKREERGKSIWPYQDWLELDIWPIADATTRRAPGMTGAANDAYNLVHDLKVNAQQRAGLEPGCVEALTAPGATFVLLVTFKEG